MSWIIIVIIAVVLLLVVLAIGLLLWSNSKSNTQIVAIQQPVQSQNPISLNIPVYGVPVGPSPVIELNAPSINIRTPEPLPLGQVVGTGQSVVGASNGSWFQVIGNDGNVVETVGVPNEDRSFSNTCPRGNVSYVSVTDNGINAVGCEYNGDVTVIGDLSTNAEVYPIAPNILCPGNYTRRAITRTAYPDFVCVTDAQCVYNRDCPQGLICANGSCTQINEDF